MNLPSIHDKLADLKHHLNKFSIKNKRLVEKGFRIDTISISESGRISTSESGKMGVFYREIKLPPEGDSSWLSKPNNLDPKHILRHVNNRTAAFS
jgi:hypothetical protein